MPDDPNLDGGGDDAALLARIQKAVDDATTGLKRTNNELKGEKSQIKEQLDALNSAIEGLGGIDVLKSLGDADTVKNLSEMKKRFEADESGKLLTEGKYDEWFDKRTDALRRDHANQLKSLQTQLEEASGRGIKAEQALRNKILEIEVSEAATKAGIEPTALKDVRLRAGAEFIFDAERDRFVLKDTDGGVVIGKDGTTPKNFSEWLEDQKESARHWWPPSKGGGADGSGPGSKSGKNLETLDMRSYIETRKKQGFKSF